MIKNCVHLTGGVIVAIGFGVPAMAASISITGNSSDFEPRVRHSTTNFDPGGSTTSDNLRIGDSSTFDFDAALFFQLPAVNPALITGANLSFTQILGASSGTVPAYNADLWGLGFTNVDPPANTTAESQDYFFVGNGPDPSAGEGGPTVSRVKLQDDILTPALWVDPNTGSPTGHDTDAGGDLALLNYITALYADPNFSPGTSYLIVRLNPDADPLAGTTTRYTIAAAEAGEESTRPVLTLTVVPEPGTTGLLVLGVLGCGLFIRGRQ